MPSIQVKLVPEDVHQVLRRRAALSGQSLQEYLLAILTEEARMPTVDEVLAHAGQQSGGNGSFASAVEIIRGDRDRR